MSEILVKMHFAERKESEQAQRLAIEEGLNVDSRKIDVATPYPFLVTVRYPQAMAMRDSDAAIGAFVEKTSAAVVEVLYT